MTGVSGHRCISGPFLGRSGRDSAGLEVTGGIQGQLTDQFAGVAVDDGIMHVTLNSDVSDTSFIANRLISENFRLTLLREEEVNLETAFMRLTKGIVQ